MTKVEFYDVHHPADLNNQVRPRLCSGPFANECKDKTNIVVETPETWRGRLSLYVRIKQLYFYTYGVSLPPHDIFDFRRLVRG